MRSLHDDSENPAWPGLVDLFAFGMTIMILLWATAQEALTLQTPAQTPMPTPTKALSGKEAELKKAWEQVRELLPHLNGVLRPDAVVMNDDPGRPGFRITRFDGQEIFFEPASSVLTVEQRIRIQSDWIKTWNLIKDQPVLVVVINGTADPSQFASQFHPKNNIELSALRAAEVSSAILDSLQDMDRQTLKRDGRLVVKGLGEEGNPQPGEDYRKYRRVYLDIEIRPGSIPTGTQ